MTMPRHPSRSVSSLARRFAERPANRFAVLLALAPASVWAHPGSHGADWPQALIHLLTEPDHLAAILLVGMVVAIFARRLLRRSSAEQPQDPARR